MKTLLACLLLTASVLAGCSGGGSDGEQVPDELTDGAPEIEVTETTGGIRGVVVDDAIRPIKGATVEVMSTDKKMVTDETGLFAFSGLDAGTYFVRASQPLYDSQQQSVEVVAGVADPEPVKFLLTRLILENPYLTTEKFDGYVVCSAGQADVGYSEECGEGVGAPCQVPVVGCQRIGGQGNNQVQYDFYIDNVDIKSIVVEMAWTPTAQTGASAELLTFVSTEWVCDPFCGGNLFICGAGANPMLMRADVANGSAEPIVHAACENFGLGSAELNTTGPITAFTWANPNSMDPTGTTNVPTVILNQPYQLFVTKSYYLPLPEGWSFVAASPNPFT